MQTPPPSAIRMWLMTGRFEAVLERSTRGYTPEGRPVRDPELPPQPEKPNDDAPKRRSGGRLVDVVI
jgi:hypothetical protein